MTNDQPMSMSSSSTDPGREPLAERGLLRVPVYEDEESFYAALLITAESALLRAAPDLFRDGRSLDALREHLADQLLTRPDLRDQLTSRVHSARAEQDHAAGSRPPSILRPVTAQDWREIANEIRTPASWGDIGDYITPQLAALVFNLRIDVITVTGNTTGLDHYGNGQRGITLIQTGDYWDATRRDPDAPPR